MKKRLEPEQLQHSKRKRAKKYKEAAMLKRIRAKAAAEPETVRPPVRNGRKPIYGRLLAPAFAPNWYGNFGSGKPDPRHEWDARIFSDDGSDQ